MSFFEGPRWSDIVPLVWQAASESLRWIMRERQRGQTRVSMLFDSAEEPRPARTKFFRIVQRCAAEARAACPGAPLKDNEANRMVARTIASRVLREQDVRIADRVHIAPLVELSLFVPTRSEVEAQALSHTEFVRQRQQRFGRKPRTWVQWWTGRDPHRAVVGYGETQLAEEWDTALQEGPTTVPPDVPPPPPPSSDTATSNTTPSGPLSSSGSRRSRRRTRRNGGGGRGRGSARGDAGATQEGGAAGSSGGRSAGGCEVEVELRSAARVVEPQPSLLAIVEGRVALPDRQTVGAGSG